jgi:recombination endonuclease VII
LQEARGTYSHSRSEERFTLRAKRPSRSKPRTCRDCNVILTPTNSCPSAFKRYNWICRRCDADRTRRRRARERGMSFEEYIAFQERRHRNQENPHCRTCGARLGSDNWIPVRKSRHDYLCQSCSKSYGSLYYDSHRRKIVARRKRYYAAHKRENKDAKLRRLFGIDLEGYEALMMKQCGKCAGCQKPFGELDDGALRPVVDHDHQSLKVRGIIHANCNCIIGFAREDPAILEGLTSYLRTSRRQF